VASKEVYLAQDTELDRKVALKILPTGKKPFEGESIIKSLHMVGSI